MYNRKDKNNTVIVRVAVLCTIMMISLSMTGCASVTSLNDGEAYEIARYMADKLLQYDRSYGVDEVVYIDPTKPTATPEMTEAQDVSPSPDVTVQPEASALPETSQTAQDGTDGTEGTMTTNWSEFFTTNEWEIKYASYDTCQQYPKNAATYSVAASAGKKLVVIYFNVINKTDHKVKIDLTDRTLNYQLSVGDKVYKPLVSILDNGGLMFLKVTLKAKAKGKAVLMFEVPEGEDLTGMRLDVISQ